MAEETCKQRTEAIIERLAEMSANELTRMAETGRQVCPKCQGTKNLWYRPSEKDYAAGRVSAAGCTERPCFHCAGTGDVVLKPGEMLALHKWAVDHSIGTAPQAVKLTGADDKDLTIHVVYDVVKP